MKVATQGDKPEWLSPPAGIVTASVCRLSGKLATEECRDADVVNKDGQLERRSMVYTEYFARGTEPTTYCDAHQPRVDMLRMADDLGGQQQSAPPSAPAVAPQTATGTTGTTVTPGTTGTTIQSVEGTQAPSSGKRSFWWRLLGRGRDKSPKEDPPPPPPKRPEGG